METETKELAVSEEKVKKAIQEFQPNPAFQATMVMLPKSYKQVMELSNILAQSGMVPDAMKSKPAACATAIMYGMELGISPMQALQNIMVVNGRPAVWGDLLKALVIGSGKCEVFDEDPPHVALKQRRGRCRLVRKGGATVEIEFSVEDATRANLWTKKGPWQEYPGRMLQARARSWAIRDLFPDILKGFGIREELADAEIIHPATPMPQERPRNVQEAQIVPEGDKVAPPTPNASPAGNQAPPNESGEVVANGDMPGDAQEPVDEGQGAFKITEDRRKALFKAWTAKKITVSAVKVFIKKTFGHDNTTDLTNAEADQLEAWIAAGGK